MNSITELDSWFSRAGSIGIAGHVKPDGDCVGSALGVYNYLKEHYPQLQVEVFLEQQPNIFSFLQRVGEIEHDFPDREPFDLFIAVDCGDERRLGGAMKYFASAKHTICIDHHESNDAFAMDNYIFPEASSTCELVYELLDPDKITKAVAECLYVGILHDTGMFSYSCTSSKTMRIAGVLMDLGIDYPWIVDRTFREKTFEQNRVLGHALDKSRLELDGQCIVSWLSREEMDQYHVLPKHMEGIVSQLRATKDVRVAIFLYQTESGDYKVSTRGSDNTNLAQLALQFGGGGHARAAGFSMEGDPEEILARLLPELDRCFREQD